MCLIVFDQQSFSPVLNKHFFAGLLQFAGSYIGYISYRMFWMISYHNNIIIIAIARFLCKHQTLMNDNIFMASF